MINLAKINNNKINTIVISTCFHRYFILKTTPYSAYMNKSIRIIHQLVERVTPQCRRIFWVSLMLISTSVNAGDIEHDKQKHFIAETVICGTTMMYTESWWQTILVGLSIGVLKETYDAGQEGNEFSKNDMVANILGCLAGASYGATVLHFHYESDTDTTTIGIKGKF